VDFVTDAHALLWHLYWPRRLGAAARSAFAGADEGRARIHIPALVVAECLMVAEKGRLPGATLAHLLPLLEELEGSDNYRLIELVPATVLASHRFARIADIFDRLIVTEAVLRGLPLLTKDPLIHDSGLVRAIWT
jgi:PIN domain nuclease of toxin-antitoxin system